MMSKIDTISQWDAKAALHSALEDVEPTDGVIVIIWTKDDKLSYRSANLNKMEAIYLLEQRKNSQMMDDFLRDHLEEHLERL